VSEPTHPDDTALLEDPGHVGALERAGVAARAADEKKASDVVVLDVARILAIADAFVIASAANTRQVRTIVDEVERQVRDATGAGPLRVEGLGEMSWVLMDFGDVVVHVFTEDMRRYYDIERLYRDAPNVAWAPASAHP
jgi:ribosome-associated protein